MNNLSIRIIRASEKDVNVFANLYFEFYKELRSRQGWSLHDFNEYLEDAKNMFKRGDVIFLAVYNSNPVGFIRISEREGSYWIEDIFVSPNYRGKGIGKLLVKTAENYIKNYDSSAYIMVLPQDRKALDFWIHMGYNILNSIELVKDFGETRLGLNPRYVEIIGKKLFIARWKNEDYSDDEKKFLDLLEKFYEIGGTDKVFLQLVNEALEKWINNKIEKKR